MTIDEFEVVNSYRTAAHPGQQIKILAELNATSVDTIVGILESHGEKVDKRTLPKPRPPKKNTPAPKNVETLADAVQQKPTDAFLTLGHIRRLCQDMDDDVIIQADGALFTGLRFLCLYDIGSDKIRRTLELVGDNNG